MENIEFRVWDKKNKRYLSKVDNPVVVYDTGETAVRVGNPCGGEVELLYSGNYEIELFTAPQCRIELMPLVLTFHLDKQGGICSVSHTISMFTLPTTPKCVSSAGPCTLCMLYMQLCSSSRGPYKPNTWTVTAPADRDPQSTPSS